MRPTHPTIHSSVKHFLHGGDYNPDQWLEMPEIIDQDMRLMPLANVNVVSLGIFSWAMLEPEEGVYTLDWMAQIMGRLHGIGVQVVLATPSGSKPAWLADTYPETLKVSNQRVRFRYGGRQNHCFTSPVYRAKVQAINSQLARRFKNHPALILWHISNEFDGDCHCPLCQDAFRAWLRNRYGTLDELNRKWYTAFWGHCFNDWQQVESPHAQCSIVACGVDWKRFVSDQTVSFLRDEIKPLREITPHIPVSTNLHPGGTNNLDSWKMAAELDVVGWDSYPYWHHAPSDVPDGQQAAFYFDLNRSLKRKPYLLMETAPGTAQWQPPLVYRFPGMHKLTSLQAVAHGSDSVMYFQWRKGRGGFEQFHGAVVDHCGHEHTHVFRDVADTGKALQDLLPVLGAHTDAKVAIYWDWNSLWVAEHAGAPVQGGQQERQTAINHYRSFWDLGIPVDMVGSHSSLDGYTLLIAPMLYVTTPDVADRLRRFVEAGGALVSTYWTGITDESGLAHLSGFPGLLRSTFGLWVEMTDAPIHVANTLVPAKHNELGLTTPRAAHSFCDLLHPEGARVLATYGQNWYAGWPCLTCHDVGKGQAYYIGTRTDGDFLADFYGALSRKLGLRRDLDGEWPDGVGVRKRSAGGRDFVFLMNFNNAPAVVTWQDPALRVNLLEATGGKLKGRIELPAYGIAVLASAASS